MLNVAVSSQFCRDYKRMKKCGMDMSLLEKILETLCSDDSLPARHRGQRTT
ncbi:type II toxin-antitoxin system YafQ family toxin [Schaalia sp. lx-100]|uniref:type II toxin-antitoxin system YafQ family toxin n=1 Tax=Schaalia sp. lx-100 TaxID=2899081 RepID=UPI003FA6B1D5